MLSRSECEEALQVVWTKVQRHEIAQHFEMVCILAPQGMSATVNLVSSEQKPETKVVIRFTQIMKCRMGEIIFLRKWVKKRIKY